MPFEKFVHESCSGLGQYWTRRADVKAAQHFVKSPVLDEDRSSPGHWLGFSAWTLMPLDDRKHIQSVKNPLDYTQVSFSGHLEWEDRRGNS